MERIAKLHVTGKLEWDETSAQPKNQRRKFKSETLIEKQCENNYTDKEEALVQQCRRKVKEFDSTSTKFEEPESIDYIETLIMTHQNSSKAWITYMVFHLKQQEINKARFIAKRALKTINFREDQERFNIWVALLNLENHYGTDESFKSVFQEALTYNDPKKIYNHVIDCYMKVGKLKELEDTAGIMLKKFKQDPDVWTKIIQYYMQSGKIEQARQLLPRSSQSLDKNNYVNVLGKCAHMEYKYGDVDKSSSMFEDILMKYPKRKDLRSIYIHLLEQQGELERANVLKNSV